jgi:hypothetical protein
MCRSVLIARSIVGILGLAAWAVAPLTFAIAHEAHKAQCTETAINAANADIQAMDDGEVKTKAMKEMQMAEQMMAKKDMEGCVTHMHNAMEATEE